MQGAGRGSKGRRTVDDTSKQYLQILYLPLVAARLVPIYSCKKTQILCDEDEVPHPHHKQIVSRTLGTAGRDLCVCVCVCVCFCVCV
jgi:hypothetical protein